VVGFETGWQDQRWVRWLKSRDCNGRPHFCPNKADAEVFPTRELADRAIEIVEDPTLCTPIPSGYIVESA